uniref:DUF7665 family protein n=1 Tax=Parerythrobacter lutipelagi TaxID=1964208 RepID=UPI0010F7611F|nr:hypothetical protein [Parerythrobacter lutipelagi]
MGDPLANRPDEVALRRDLAAGRFLLGVATGRWRLESIAFPHAVVSVIAADGIAYGLRFECSDYPRTAVTACPWDVERDQPLAPEMWPKGTSRIPLAFNPQWKNATCLYLPCDRISVQGHDPWRTKHPQLLWDPSKGICKYLAIVHELLNSGEYGGRRAVAA